MRIEELCSKQPRYMLSMELSDGDFRVGANCHYTLDTPVLEAIQDFFLRNCKEQHAEYRIEKTPLEITLLDVVVKNKTLYLPKEAKNG